MFEYEFTEDGPGSVLEEGTICTVCLSIAKEPSEVQCCGSVFCNDCVRRCVSMKERCPNCNVTCRASEIQPSHFLRRRHKSMRVKCIICGECGSLADMERNHPAPCVDDEADEAAVEVLTTIHDVENLVKIPSAIGSSVVIELRQYMQAHHHDEDIQKRIVETLSILSLEDDNRIPLGQVGVHRDIQNSMRKHLQSVHIQQAACGALLNLIFDPVNCRRLGEAGVHLDLLRAMDMHANEAEVQSVACGALLNLCMDHENRTRLGAANVHLQIRKAMQRHKTDSAVQASACGALGCLALNPKNQVRLGEADMHFDLQQAMRDHRDSAMVQKNCLGTLLLLCCTPENRSKLAEAKVYVQIQIAMQAHRQNLEMQINGIGSLAALTRKGKQATSAIVKLMIYIDVQIAMRTFPDCVEVQRLSCFFLGNLLKKRRNQLKLRDADFRQDIHSAIVHHWTDKELQNVAFMALKHM